MKNWFSTLGEQECQRLETHLHWQEGFALLFIFISHQSGYVQLRQRIADVCTRKQTTLQIYTPQNPEHLTEQVIQLIQANDPVCQASTTPLWLVLNAQSGEDWLAALQNLLRRLNERRELLRSQLQRPLVLILPENFFTRSAELAPDLWSIKLSCVHFGDDCFIRDNLVIKNKGPIKPLDRAVSDLDEAVWKEWQRVAQQPPSNDQLYIAWQAIEAALQVGRLDLAGEVAEQAVNVAQHLEASPPHLRELSISLSYVGEVALQRGDWHEAEIAYQESLHILKSLQQQLGDKPHILHDLSVALYNVGKVAFARGVDDVAESQFQECLNIRRHLRQLDDSPQTLSDLTPVLHSLGLVVQAAGQLALAESYFLEGVQISRDLRQQLGNTPECLRNLCVSLNYLGQIAEIQQRWDTAEIAYQECMQLNRDLINQQGESIENMRDLSVWINSMGRVAYARGNWDKAETAYLESLELRRQLRNSIGDTPQLLRDLSVSLNNLGKVYAAIGRWQQAEVCLRESLQICRTLLNKLGDNPTSLSDLGVTLENLATVLLENENKLASVEVLNEVLSIWQNLQQRFPEVSEYAKQVNRLLNLLNSVTNQPTS
jgi:tetratricopeptide (TPR) repeat protein